MNIEVFERKIKKELQKLTREQQVYFAWVAAVRALPFLGQEGNFDFWDEDNRSRHLYGIFNALDYPIANVYSFDVIIYAARASEEAIYKDSVAAYVARAVERVARSAVEVRAEDVVEDANRAVVRVFEDNLKALSFMSDFQKQLLMDCRAIKEEQLLKGDVSFYGIVWSNFQKALVNEGCAYWGKLYKEIFGNNFRVDKKSLQLRIEQVPEEIKVQGAAAVGVYLEKLEKRSRRLNEARILILGDKGVGKTCIARRLIDPKAAMTKEDESTLGVDTHLWEPEGTDLNIRIWDFAGHTVTHAAHRFFLSERCVYLVVYDGRTDNASTLTYWLDHMKNYGGADSKAFILVNKKDKNRVDIEINNLQEHYSIEKVFTFSIKNDLNALEDFRTEIRDYIDNNPSWRNQKIPEEYYLVKEELEAIFDSGNLENGEEHITKEHFLKIAEKHKATDTQQLLKDLHHLGVSLWYENMEEYNTLILNPDWISNGVYQLINWASNHKKYEISLVDFEKVFKENAKRYPEDKYRFLFQLMINYELAYKTANGERLVIPHLLRKDRPKNLPDFAVGESVLLRYKAEQPLPPNTISRFIVRHSEEIKKYRTADRAWCYGVLLEDDLGSLALVREEDRMISVSVKGKNKTAFMSSLRETLNTIFQSYKSEQPELQYRIKRYGEIPDYIEKQNPLWVPERTVVNHIKRERPYYDDLTDQEILLNTLASRLNLSIRNLNLVSKGDLYLDSVDHKTVTHNTFNFNNCNITLQGNLNDLAQRLAQKGHKEEAEELQGAAALLEEVEDLEDKDAVKKKGIMSRLKSIVEDLGDKDSTLHKSVKGIKKGVKIAQDIGKRYNEIAKWMGLDPISDLFL